MADLPVTHLLNPQKRMSALSPVTRVYTHNLCLATATAAVSSSGDVGLLLPAVPLETKPGFISWLLKSQKCCQRQSQSAVEEVLIFYLCKNTKTAM